MKKRSELEKAICRELETAIRESYFLQWDPDLDSTSVACLLAGRIYRVVEADRRGKDEDA